LFRSVAVLAHRPPQETVGGGHAHAPLAHAVPPLQVTPQAPQLFGSESTFAQKPAQLTVGGTQPPEQSPPLHT
jgi:hypothetical protein